MTRAPRFAPPPAADHGDRTFVTLLSLNFMLLAFFVVLGTAASVDQPRAASVAKSLRIVFAAPDGGGEQGKLLRLTARQALQAGVAEAFADVLPLTHRITGEDGDRVDLSLSPDVLGRESGAAAAVRDGIARLMRAAPPGVHYQLILRGGHAGDTAALAAALQARGVGPRHLMTEAAPAVESGGDISFTFLLLEGEDEPPFGRLGVGAP